MYLVQQRSDMSNLISFWTFIVAWSFFLRVSTEELVIIRKVNKKDIYHKDRFNIRRSKCIDIRQTNKCGFYGGFERAPDNPCKCQCPPRRGTIMKRKKHWRCVSNEVLRQTQDCGIYFMYETSASYLRILTDERWQSFHAATSECLLRQTSYLTCDGSWEINAQINQYIDLMRGGFDQVARGYAYQIRIRKNGILEGKLVKVYFNCTAFGGQPCLLVKMNGKQNCFKTPATSRNHISLRKNTKKNVMPKLLTSNRSMTSTEPNMNWTTGLPSKSQNNVSEIQHVRKGRDLQVTEMILTVTALLLALVIVGLAVNLCCSKSKQESFKGTKHIFQRSNHRRIEQAITLRTASLSICHSITTQDEESLCSAVCSHASSGSSSPRSLREIVS